ncbi:hypothetical protein LCGC14_1351340 [marine sediment metagenome]|uniref:DNA methylase N-4/N-6 domain-containing protein n=1 Tax=marine sediment metagenome TaxID=412755 RepID=A0A0F9KAV8_9ZZZZ
MKIQHGHAVDLIAKFNEQIDLLASDPPYAFGGSTGEHELSAAVAIALRESARLLKPGCWCVVYCASSWRSTNYMIEAMRGILQPIRVATWCKPNAVSKARTTGWGWATVNVVAFRRGKDKLQRQPIGLDYIEAKAVKTGRRAELPSCVADWSIAPFVVPGGVILDPFAGSGALLLAGERANMTAIGFDIDINCELT